MSRLTQLFASKEREFFDLFEEAASNSVRAAELLVTILDEWPDYSTAMRDMVIAEQEGDRITDDIIALASALDDIVDFIEEVADFLGLYRIEAPMEQAERLAAVLRDATRQISEAMP